MQIMKYGGQGEIFNVPYHNPVMCHKHMSGAGICSYYLEHNLLRSTDDLAAPDDLRPLPRDVQSLLFVQKTETICTKLHKSASSDNA